MSTQELKSAREKNGWTQKEAAARLGFSQPYLSMLEKGLRFLPPKLVRKVIKEYSLPVTALPLPQLDGSLPVLDPQLLAEQLSALGYSGFTYLQTRRKKKNPGEVLLTALAMKNLEARLTEALPWLLLQYWDSDTGWLVSQAKQYNLQNRLGFVVNLARRVAERAGLCNDDRSKSLMRLEANLEQSRLAREDTLCQASLPERERQWLKGNRPDEARHWNLLTDWRPEVLRYAE